MKNEIINSVADMLIEKLEAYASDSNPVFMARIPKNYVSSKLYRGINTLILSFKEMKNRYQSSQWATFKQWSESNFHVKKGEKSTNVIFWSPIFEKSVEEDPVTGQKTEVESVVRFISRTYKVFNKSQVEGTGPNEDAMVEENPMLEEEALQFFKGSVEINTTEGKSFFEEGKVFLPAREEFKSSEEYISTLSYLTASSIRKSMEKKNWKAIDELVSEIAAGFISGYLGYNYKFSDQNLHLIQSWIKTLGGNKNLVFKACAEAQAVLDRFINSHSNTNDLLDMLG